MPKPGESKYGRLTNKKANYGKYSNSNSISSNNYHNKGISRLQFPYLLYLIFPAIKT